MWWQRMKANTVATLAVGTEITDGQISDRNSQWLSARAGELGYEVLEHRAVPDDRAVILRALSELSERARLIFVTGGLGPTSDDFTRECIAEFAGEPLEWHEPSWSAILERLNARGAKATENQKQQCFYPKSATILKNAKGTANGFALLNRNGTRIVSLPGPPSEIEAIWNDGLRAMIESAGHFEKPRLTLLRTMGLGEGALASRVEEIFDNVLRASEGAVARPVIGYRATAPYVEIKIWATAAQEKIVEHAAIEIRREFSSILVNEGAEDLADGVLARIATEGAAGIRTVLVDDVTNGEVINRLFRRAGILRDEALASALRKNFTGVIGGGRAFDYRSMLLPEAETTVLQLARGEGELEIRIVRGAREKHVTLPKLAGSLDSERGRKWAIEFALREWERT